MLVGVTGPSGAGKGIVAGAFAARGFAVIDADKVAREVVMPGESALQLLAAEFGADILTPDGSLNRRLLASRAFASRSGTDSLNSIMLGVIARRMTDRAEAYGKNGQDCVFDAPLLIEAGLDQICDVCVAVTAPPEIRTERLMRRDGLTEEEIRSRISRQHGDEYYTSRCEYVIVNDGDMQRLNRLAERVADEIMTRGG